MHNLQLTLDEDGMRCLRTISVPVDDFRPEHLLPIQESMLEVALQYEEETGSPCPGLAAPQVGLNQRIIMMRISDDITFKHWRFMYNPTYVASRGDFTRSFEGCISVPDFCGEVIRPQESLFYFFDEYGHRVPGENDYFRAREEYASMLCHQLDHLNGVLFFDNAVALKRLSTVGEDG